MESPAIVLFQALNSGASLPSITDPLLSQAEDSHAVVVATVVNFVVSVAGIVDVEVGVESFKNDENIHTVLEEVVMRAVAQGEASMLLLNRDQTHRRLRKAFPEFFKCLVLTANSRKNMAVIEELTTWLLAMNESGARSLRHAALVALCAMTDGLLEVAETATAAAAAPSSQGRSSSGGRASPKKKPAPDAAAKKVEALISEIFGQSLHNRIKDVAPEIRLAAVQRLKVWMLAVPKRYLEDHYLRYMTLALFDKRPDIRLEALELLVAILAGFEDGLEKLKRMLNRYATRIVDMCKDADTKCANAAIKVCTLLIRASYEISHNQLDAILEGLLDDRSVIRGATGAFLNTFIKSQSPESASPASATQLTFLKALMATLDGQCEGLIEEYIVDSLWKPEAIPLAEQVDAVGKLAVSAKEPDATMGLRLAASLLRRAAGGEAQLGPLPKDDFCLVTKGKAKNEDARVKFLAALSKKLAECIPDALKKHADNASILEAVSTVIEHIDFGSATATAMKKIIKDFSAASQTADLTMERAVTLSAAWRKLAFSDYTESSTGEVAFKEIVKASSRAASAKKATPADFARLLMIAAVIPHAASAEHTARVAAEPSRHTAVMLRLTSAIIFYNAMWSVAAAGTTDTGSQEARDSIEAAIPQLLGIAEYVASHHAAEAIALVPEIVTFCADLLLAPQISPSDEQMHAMIRLAAGAFESSAVHIRNDTTALKESVKRIGDPEGADRSVWEAYVSSRSAIAVAESSVLKMTLGLSRLYLLQKAGDATIPQFLSLWTVSQSKSTNDGFKALFHAVRERQGGLGVPLERNILASAIAATDEGNIASLSALAQLGAKLASIHFAPTDKYAEACVQLIDHAVASAEAQPLWLHVMVPYGSKLRQGDAAAAYHAIMAKRATALGASPYWSAFVSSLARSAKIADAAGITPGKTPKNKRAREEADAELSAALAGASPAGKEPSNDGWRSRQLNAESTLVATQEWD